MFLHDAWTAGATTSGGSEVRIKAAWSSPHTITVWVTKKNPPAKFPIGTVVAQGAKELLDTMSTTDSAGTIIPGTCNASPAAPLPPFFGGDPDDTKTGR